MTANPLIEIEGLRVVFHGDDGCTTHAVDGVDRFRPAQRFLTNAPWMTVWPGLAISRRAVVQS